MSIRVLLADDHKIVRQGIRTLLEDEPDIEMVGEAGDGRTTVRLVRQLSPHVVVMDVAMPDLNGIEATRQIIAEIPGVKVVVLSMHSDKRFVVEMFRAGASGYLLKDCAFEELAHAIRAVVKNKAYLTPEVAGIVIQDYAHHLLRPDSPLFSILTARQREVLQLLAEGKTTNQIASRLHLSVKTVETHRRQIMNKLGVHSIAELTKYAIREGLTCLEK